MSSRWKRHRRLSFALNVVLSAFLRKVNARVRSLIQNRPPWIIRSGQWAVEPIDVLHLFSGCVGRPNRGRRSLISMNIVDRPCLTPHSATSPSMRSIDRKQLCRTKARGSGIPLISLTRCSAFRKNGWSLPYAWNKHRSRICRPSSGRPCTRPRLCFFRDKSARHVSQFHPYLQHSICS